MRLFLQDGPARLQILSRSHVREFRDVGAAREFLRPLLATEGNVTAIRSAVGYEHANAFGDHDLLDHLARRIVSEGLQIVSCADGYLAAIQGTFTSQAAQTAAQQTTTTTPLEDEEAAATTATPEETHFIEIELVDDDGNPVANEAYLVELPDGTQKTGRTDGGGRAKITGVDPGTAKVSFPDLDKSAYKKDAS
ncbi:MAG TPA: carboxypeptidase-like regulatory domain-containing protein [Thermoanaerobaculia bacterium]|nr:carboxypeptidase-like regulatory domain-containing protein [Thermoanaerobaculia bacterium]